MSRFLTNVGGVPLFSTSNEEPRKSWPDYNINGGGAEPLTPVMTCIQQYGQQEKVPQTLQIRCPYHAQLTGYIKRQHARPVQHVDFGAATRVHGTQQVRHLFVHDALYVGHER